MASGSSSVKPCADTCKGHCPAEACMSRCLFRAGLPIASVKYRPRASCTDACLAPSRLSSGRPCCGQDSGGIACSFARCPRRRCRRKRGRVKGLQHAANVLPPWRRPTRSSSSCSEHCGLAEAGCALAG